MKWCAAYPQQMAAAFGAPGTPGRFRETQVGQLVRRKGRGLGQSSPFHFVELARPSLPSLLSNGTILRGHKMRPIVHRHHNYSYVCIVLRSGSALHGYSWRWILPTRHVHGNRPVKKTLGKASMRSTYFGCKQDKFALWQPRNVALTRQRTCQYSILSLLTTIALLNK